MNITAHYTIILLTLFFTGCSKQIPDNERPVTENRNTSVITEKIAITTEDSIKLSANYFYKSSKKDIKEPLIILIHQFRSNKEQWAVEFVSRLIDSGYKVIAYDIRGHGESGKVNYELSNLLSDGTQAPKDVDAVLKWAYGKKDIDSARIGVIGTSIGASLGIYAKLKKSIGSVIAVSGGKGTFEAFTGYDDRMMVMGRLFARIPDVLFVCGKFDGNYADEEKAIYDNYLGEPKEILFYDSEKHGKDLIKQFPEIEEKSINWFKKTL
jgi:pimeloyl-ACP methyl ester carboxylesterase